jgi:hypothetical protein
MAEEKNILKWESAANFSRRESAVHTMRHSMGERTGGGAEWERGCVSTGS